MKEGTGGNRGNATNMTPKNASMGHISLFISSSNAPLAISVNYLPNRRPYQDALVEAVGRSMANKKRSGVKKAHTVFGGLA